MPRAHAPPPWPWPRPRCRCWAGSAAPRPSRKPRQDRKSTRLNSSHLGISYAVFCLKKKKNRSKHQTLSKTLTDSRRERKHCATSSCVGYLEDFTSANVRIPLGDTSIVTDILYSVT